jgi:hypothetical protein
MTAGLLDKPWNTRIAMIRRLFLVALGVSVGAFQLCGFLGLRINTSPSLPMGLYITTADGDATLVEFCPAEPFAAPRLPRFRYLPGRCSPAVETCRRQARRRGRTVHARNLRERSASL